MDEASLLANLVDRPVLDMRPLDHDQLAPPAFLILERLMVRLPLPVRHAARLVPLLSGLLSLVLIRDVARRCLGPWGVPIAVGMFGLSDYALYYSSEIKQYSSDMAWTLGLLALALRARPDSPRSLLTLAAVGLAATWSCHTSCFVLAAVGSGLAATAWRRGDRRTATIYAIMSILWAMSFGACYLASQRLLTTDRFIWNWWDFAFLPVPPRSLADLGKVGLHLANVLTCPVGLWTPGDPRIAAAVGVLVYLAGVASLAKGRPIVLYLLVAPIVFTLAASGMRKYPFHGRLLMFLVPLAWLVLAGGIEAIGRRTHGVVAAALVVGLLVVPASDASDHLTRERAHPFDSHGDLRNDLLDHLERLRPRTPPPRSEAPR